MTAEIPHELHIRRVYKDYKSERILEAVNTLGSFTVSEMNKWAEPALPVIMEEVVSSCKVMGVNRISVFTGLGLKGAGKGTNVAALRRAANVFKAKGLDRDENIPGRLRRVLSDFSGESFQTITGTKGMLFMPGPGYEEYKGIADSLMAVTGAGQYVEDEFTSSLVFMRMGLGISKGHTSFSHDLHPRTKRQYQHQKKLFNLLDGFGVGASADMVYFSLMDVNELPKLEADRKGYAAEAGKVSSIIKEFIDQNKDLGAKDVDEQNQQIKELLKRTMEEGDDKTRNFISEVSASLQRSQIRKEKAGSGARVDETPLKTLNRVRSDLGAAASFLGIDSVRVVCAKQQPGKVVEDFIKTLISPEDAESQAVKNFIGIAQKKADEIVSEV